MITYRSAKPEDMKAVVKLGDDFRYVFVSPDYRGTDVASRLVTEFENQSKIQTGQNCMLYVRSDNSRARHFYEKNGICRSNRGWKRNMLY